MKPFLLGKKLGMTQTFDDNGAVVPVTIIEAGPCVVTQLKTVDKDGYNAVQIGYGASRNITKSLQGHVKKSGQTPKHLREIRLADTTDLKVGSTLTVAQFQDQKSVTVSGVSKGKGFAGVIKRHNFHRGPETHGSDHHRKPGSIGGMFPQRVLKGQRLPGHMGAERVTTSGLDVVTVNQSKNLIVVRGAVPGAVGSLIEIKA